MPRSNLVRMAHEAYEEKRRIVAPLMGFPGVRAIGSNIKTAQQNYGEHYKAIRKLAHLYHPDLIFPLMDLSVEANAMGRYTLFPKDESATVPKDTFHMDELEQLREINISFDGRLNGYVETMRLMDIGLPADMLRGAYVTGPYSLAALILGSDAAAIATIMEPDTFTTLVEFAAERIHEYVRLLIAAGAQVVCVLEPSAVMLGPDQFEQFSASFVRHITTSCRYSGIDVIYHTCGNTMRIVDKMIGTGVSGVSLDSADAGVDLPAVAENLSEEVTVIGNINPATTMLRGTPEAVERETLALLHSMDRFPNFILSTGCDLPGETPLDNIRALMNTARAYQVSS